MFNIIYRNLLKSWWLLLQLQMKFHPVVPHSLNKTKGSAVLNYKISH
jgi:hypothetical protein